jgi:Ca2+-binding RTX toxin-like protein
MLSRYRRAWQRTFALQRPRSTMGRGTALGIEVLEDRCLLSGNIVMVSATGDGNETLSLSYHVDGTVGPFSINLYRAPAAAFSKNDDVLLGTIKLTDASDLAAGDHTITRGIGTDAMLPGAGAVESETDYFILAVANPTGAVPETSLSDNTAAFTGAYHVAGGDVFVHGTAAGDTATIAPSGNNLTITLNSIPTYSYTASDVSAVRIRTHDGNDTVDGTTTSKSLHVWGGAGDDVITGGVGDDFLNGGDGSDTITDHHGSTTVLGPEYPPPGNVTLVRSGDGLGAATGRTFDFTNFDVTAFNQLRWMPVSVQLSMNADQTTNPTLTSSETLVFNPNDSASDLAHGVGIWTGSTLFTHEVGNSPVTDTLNTRMRLQVVDANGDPVALVDTSADGAPEPAAAAVVVAGPGLPAPLGEFKATLFMEANFGGTWQPVTDLFNAQNTNQSKHAYTSFSGGFFHTARIVDHDVLTGGNGANTLISSDGTATVTETGDLNMTLVGNGTSATLTGSAGAATPLSDNLQRVSNVSLTGGAGNNRLDASAYLGNVTLSGGGGSNTLIGGAGASTVLEVGDTNFKLTDRKLAGPGTDTLQNIGSAVLIGGKGSNSFDVSGFSGPVSLDGGPGGNDQVVVNADDSFTLRDNGLTYGSRQVNLHHINGAVLTGGDSGSTFDVSGWSGNAGLHGGKGSNALVASGAADFTLTNASLKEFTGQTFALAGIGQATLTVLGSTGHTIDAHAFTGNVVLTGGAGNDTLLPGSGNSNTVVGGGGSDTAIATGSGILTLAGDSNQATLTELHGQNTVFTDTLQQIAQVMVNGSGGANTLDASGYTAKATLVGGPGNDTIHGGSGTTFISGGPGLNTLIGGTGTNILLEQGDASYKLSDTKLTGTGTDLLQNIPNAMLVGGKGNDSFDVSNFSGMVRLDGVSGAKDQVIAAADTNFTLTNSSLTYAGRQVALAHIKNAVLSGGDGDNTFDVGGWSGAATLNGGKGTNAVVASAAADFTLSNTLLKLSTGAVFALSGITQASLTVLGNDSHTVDAHAFVGNTTLTGGSNNDSFLPSIGTSTINGGGGSDSITAVGNGIMTLTGDATAATLTGTAGISPFTANLQNIALAILVGGSGSDTLDAAAFGGNAVLIGGGGSDTLRGGAGLSVLLGGAGSDTLDAGTGRSMLVGGTGKDVLDAGGATGGDDILIGGTAAFYNEATGNVNAATLGAIMQEWASADDYPTRVAALSGPGSTKLNTTTLKNDGSVDTLNGGTGSGLDWFLAATTGPTADIRNNISTPPETLTLIN